MDLGVNGNPAIVFATTEESRAAVLAACLAPDILFNTAGGPQSGEFGDLCAYLCSTQAGYITGQSVLIDGGAYPGTF